MQINEFFFFFFPLSVTMRQVLIKKAFVSNSGHASVITAFSNRLCSDKNYYH